LTEAILGSARGKVEIYTRLPRGARVVSGQGEEVTSGNGMASFGSGHGVVSGESISSSKLAEGANEVVQFQHADGDLSGQREPGIVFSYLFRDSGGLFDASRYENADGDSRRGNELRVSALIPESIAAELEAAIRQNPSYVREIVHKLVVQEGGVSEDEWNGRAESFKAPMCPPYEALLNERPDWEITVTDGAGNSEALVVNNPVPTESNIVAGLRGSRAPQHTGVEQEEVVGSVEADVTEEAEPGSNAPDDDTDTVPTHPATEPTDAQKAARIEEIRRGLEAAFASVDEINSRAGDGTPSVSDRVAASHDAEKQKLNAEIDAAQEEIKNSLPPTEEGLGELEELLSRRASEARAQVSNLSEKIDADLKYNTERTKLDAKIARLKGDLEKAEGKVFRGKIPQAHIDRVMRLRAQLGLAEGERSAFYAENGRPEDRQPGIERPGSEIDQSETDQPNSEQVELPSWSELISGSSDTDLPEAEAPVKRTFRGRLLSAMLRVRQVFTIPEQMNGESDKDYNARVEADRKRVKRNRIGGLVVGVTVVAAGILLAKSGHDSTATLDIMSDAPVPSTGGNDSGLVNDAISGATRQANKAAGANETATGVDSRLGRFARGLFSARSDNTSGGTIIDNSDLTNALPGSRSSGATGSAAEAITQPATPPTESFISVGLGGGYGDALAEYRPGATINWDAWNKATEPGGSLRDWLLENGAYLRPEDGGLGIADLSGEVPTAVLDKILEEIPDILNPS